MPTFSIIIPVYNVESWLRQCLNSVRQQTYDDWEAVCVNDGSIDNSLSILEEYASRDSRFRIISQTNAGLSAARNTGLDAAMGKYILFLDSDDWLEITTLEIISNNLNDEDILCFSGRRYDEANSIFLSADKLPCATYDSGMEYYNSNALAQRDFAFVCVVLRCYHRQFLLDNRLRFREGILHEDNEFTPRVCVRAQKVRVISDILYNYRVRQGSIMRSRNLHSKESLIIIGNELSELFSHEGSIDKTIIYRFLTQCYQMAFFDNNQDEDRCLLPLVDWPAYHRVSCTKIRHRIQYKAIKISPRLFRIINRILAL